MTSEAFAPLRISASGLPLVSGMMWCFGGTGSRSIGKVWPSFWPAPPTTSGACVRSWPKRREDDIGFTCIKYVRHQVDTDQGDVAAFWKDLPRIGELWSTSLPGKPFALGWLNSFSPMGLGRFSYNI